MTRSLLLLPLLGALVACAAVETDDSADETEDTNTEDTDFAGEGELVLNELMAKNDSYPDENGAAGDWVEVLNVGLGPVHLDGYGVTDGFGEATPWPLSGVLAAGERVLVWCDDGADGLHADFKLSGDGETITLVNAAGEAVDEVSFGALEADQAWGRSPDGSGDWALVEPSPGSANP